MRESVQGFIRDPVFGTTVNPNSTDLIAAYNGQDYYFCAESCLEAFEENPERYLKKKGFSPSFSVASRKPTGKHLAPGDPPAANREKIDAYGDFSSRKLFLSPKSSIDITHHNVVVKP